MQSTCRGDSVFGHGIHSKEFWDPHPGSHDDSGNVPRDRNEQPTCTNLKKNTTIIIMVIITTIIIIIKDTRGNGTSDKDVINKPSICLFDKRFNAHELVLSFCM